MYIWSKVCDYIYTMSVKSIYDLNIIFEELIKIGISTNDAKNAVCIISQKTSQYGWFKYKFCPIYVLANSYINNNYFSITFVQFIDIIRLLDYEDVYNMQLIEHLDISSNLRYLLNNFINSPLSRKMIIDPCYIYKPAFAYIQNFRYIKNEKFNSRFNS